MSAPRRHLLLPHPVSERGAVQGLVQELAVDVSLDAAGTLLLVYRLTGDLAHLRLPEPREPLRTDGLWRHSCFEAFVARAGSAEYWEFNFSPSGAWAAYHFAAYREGMAPLLRGSPPQVRSQAGDDHLELHASVDLGWLIRSPESGLRLGLAAVIEDKARVLSYWALKHPAEKPDFHHAGAFVVELP